MVPPQAHPVGLSDPAALRGAAVLSDVYAPIQVELAAARALLARELEHGDPRLAAIYAHALSSPGKGIRPALLLLCGRASGTAGDRHVVAAAAIELVHCATLVHDDVIDEATQRRRRSTVNARWGADVSMLVGDLLFARALALLAPVADSAQVQLVARAVAETCEGELLQLLASRGEPLDEARYLAIIGKKTGALCGAACALGAALAGQDAERVARFDAFGRSLGVAFQIMDDCLDIRGDERVVGKTLGTDLRGGRATLPVLYAREHADGEEQRQLHAVLDAAASASRGSLAALLRECGAFDYCERSARQFIRQALAELDGLGDHPARHFLAALADYVVQRDL
jgi:octaprenyl-diphosphate synthase